MATEATTRMGRPRSERARRAVLHAVDDLLVDVGYAAMTMKGIAERAGVGRQTLYRWWTTKAEILLEAVLEDVEEELTTPAHPDAAEDLLTYARALSGFLTASPAGLAYRALVGEAQHDPEVRTLVHAADLLGASARTVLDRVRPDAPGMPSPDLSAAQFIGPVVYRVLTARAAFSDDELRCHVRTLLASWAV
ncbi:TetR/AcrR family transcriptional regulator [Umezawaea endophytica]|uniref:TetR/AcrR family transcriptional regulator n=1 Tax=Umezawaea endophytica TaxID=1654476 RepID=A0A9X3AFD0_9PSEU|nr:TetR/AcrR family transcriptional regulator [Umezawaea endophytica]MCS7478607.1 TetR/AcrR family transcriptional regulator [Umezawaea endophytica]